MIRPAEPLSIRARTILSRQDIAGRQEVILGSLIVGIGSLQVLFHALDVLDQQVFTCQLKMVTKVVHPLMVFEMNVVVKLANPAHIRPVEIPVGVTAATVATWLSKHPPLIPLSFPPARA